MPSFSVPLLLQRSGRLTKITSIKVLLVVVTLVASVIVFVRQKRSQKPERWLLESCKFRICCPASIFQDPNPICYTHDVTSVVQEIDNLLSINGKGIGMQPYSCLASDTIFLNKH